MAMELLYLINKAFAEEECIFPCLFNERQGNAWLKSHLIYICVAFSLVFQQLPFPMGFRGWIQSVE